MEKQKVAAYARVSTERDDQVNSFESQVRYFTSCITREESWTLVKVYADEGRSGTQTKKRNGFNQMIADALSGQIDLILTKEVSRFARNTLDSISFTRTLKEHGVYVIFLLDGIDTRQPDAELRLTIMSALAQEESRKISERVKWGQTRQMERGIVFGRDLLGYRVQDGALRLVEEEAALVRLIFHKYVYEGKGVHIIARELTEAGIPPFHNKEGAVWSNSTLLKILKNEKYVGDLCQKKSWTKNYLDHKKRENHGEEGFIYLKDHHPEIAIISRPLWDVAQAELARRSSCPIQKTKYSNRYWCSGKLFCASCGKALTHKSKTLPSGSYHAWRCQAQSNPSVQCQEKAYVNEKSLQSVIYSLLALLLPNRSALKLEMEQALASLPPFQPSQQSSCFSEKMSALSRKKERLISLCISGDLTAEEFRQQKNRIEAELKALSTCQKDAEKTEPKSSAALAQAIALLAFCQPSAPHILAAVTKKILVYPTHQLDIQLNVLSFAVRVQYQVSGKADTYQTQIQKITPLPPLPA